GRSRPTGTRPGLPSTPVLKSSAMPGGRVPDSAAPPRISTAAPRAFGGAAVCRFPGLVRADSSVYQPFRGDPMSAQQLPTDHDRSGGNAGLRPAARYQFDEFVAAHPDVTAVVVVAAGLLALSTPAVLVFAVLQHLTVLGLAAMAAS